MRQSWGAVLLAKYIMQTLSEKGEYNTVKKHNGSKILTAACL